MNSIRICTRHIQKPLLQNCRQSLIQSPTANLNNRMVMKISKRFASGGGRVDFDHPPQGYTLREWRFWWNYEYNWGPTCLGTIGLSWWIYRLYTWRDEFFGVGLRVWFEPYWP